MKNSAYDLFKFARSKGYKVAVQDPEDGEVLQKSSADWKAVKAGIESTGYATMIVRDVEKKETIAWALVITHDNPEEWVSDYGCNDFMEEWDKQYSH